MFARCAAAARAPFSLAGGRAFATDVTLRNLPFGASADALETMLKCLGTTPPSKVEVPVTKAGKPRALAWATYPDAAAAKRALAALEGAEFEGRPVAASIRGPLLHAKLAPLPTLPPPDGLVDNFSKLRRDLQFGSDPHADDLHLKNILRDLYKDEHEVEDSMGTMKAAKVKFLASKEAEKAKLAVAKAAQAADADASSSRVVATQGPHVAGTDAALTAVETAAAAAALAAYEKAQEEDVELDEERLAVGRADPGARVGSGTDLLPGIWCETIVDVSGVQKITTGGRILSYRVLVVVGNAQGAGGFGVGKASDPSTATARAIRDAKKSLIVVDRYKNTALYHSTEGRHNSCRVVLRAVPPGFGFKGGNIQKQILYQMGIADCTAKATGRRNPFAVVRSVFKALARHQSLAEVSLLRGRRILELEWRRGI